MYLSDGRSISIAPQAFAETAPLFQQAYFVPSTGLALEARFASYAKMYCEQIWVYAVVRKMSTLIARLGTNVWDMKDAGTDSSAEAGKKLDTSSPYATLMAKPCPYLDPFSYWLWVIATKEIYGESFAKKQRGADGKPNGLLPMHPAQTTIERDDEGNLLYRFGGQPNQLIPEKDVVVYSDYHPDNTMRGLSTLEPLRSTLMVEDSSRRAVNAWMANAGRPSMVLETDKRLGREGRERLKTAFENAHRGSGKAGGTLVLEDAVKATQMQMNSKDLEYIGVRELGQTEVCGAYDVPPSAVHILKDATFCLPADELVSTQLGPKRIADITTGDRVWSFDGQSMVLADVAWSNRSGRGPIYTVRTANRTLRATGNHPVLVARRPHLSGEGNRRRYGPSEFVYVRTDELTPGDLLVAAHGHADACKRTHAPNGRAVTTELMEFCGLLMGDGTVNSKSVSIAHAEDAPYIDHYRQNATATFLQHGDREIRWHAQSERSSRFCSQSAADELRELGFGGTAHTKTVPGWVFECSTDMRLAFLRGIIEADGSVSKTGRIAFGLCNPTLVGQVRDMMIGLGIPVTNLGVSKRPARLPNGRMIDATLYRFTATDPGRNQLIGSHHPEDTRRLTAGKPFNVNTYTYADRTGRVIAPPLGAQLSKVSSVSIGESEDVYDLCVPETGNFVADGLVVHNTNVTEQLRSIYRDCASWRITSVEQATDFYVGSEFNGEKKLKFNTAEVMRGNIELLAPAAATLVNASILMPAEVRPWFDVGDGGPASHKLYANGTMKLLDDIFDPPEPPALPAAPDGNPALPGQSHVPPPAGAPGPRALPTGGSSRIPGPQSSAATRQRAQPALTAAATKYVRSIGGHIGRGTSLQESVRGLLKANPDDMVDIASATAHIIERKQSA